MEPARRCSGPGAGTSLGPDVGRAWGPGRTERRPDLGLTRGRLAAGFGACALMGRAGASNASSAGRSRSILGRPGRAGAVVGCLSAT